MIYQPRTAILLPCNDLIHDSLLFACGLTKIDTGSLNALMPHKIGKQSNVIILLQKVLCVAVTERVRIYDLFIKPILLSVVFELLGDTSCSDTLAKAIQKQVARCTLLSFEPFKSFITKLFWEYTICEAYRL